MPKKKKTWTVFHNNEMILVDVKTGKNMENEVIKCKD